MRSMLRQWVLRSEYWSRRERPIPVAGMHSLQEFHGRSDQLQKKARRMNLAWIIFAIPVHVVVLGLIHPRNTTLSAEAFYAVLPVLILAALYRAFNRGFVGASEEFVSLTSSGDDRQTELAHRWESLQNWSDYMGYVLVFMALAWVSPAIFASLIGVNPAPRSWASVNFIVFMVQAALFFAILKRSNQRAALALQQEMEASHRLKANLV